MNWVMCATRSKALQKADVLFEGAVDYVRRTGADFWVLQRNSTNIIRGFSIMSMRDYREIRSAAEVESASPVLLLCASANIGARDYTLFLTGYRPEEPMGALLPWRRDGHPRMTARSSSTGSSRGSTAWASDRPSGYRA
jgi:hypothetical protein